MDLFFLFFSLFKFWRGVPLQDPLSTSGMLQLRSVKMMTYFQISGLKSCPSLNKVVQEPWTQVGPVILIGTKKN